MCGFVKGKAEGSGELGGVGPAALVGQLEGIGCLTFRGLGVDWRGRRRYSWAFPGWRGLWWRDEVLTNKDFLELAKDITGGGRTGLGGRKVFENIKKRGRRGGLKGAEG